MVLKIVTDRFVLHLALDTGSFENLRIANTGQLKDLGRLDGTARYHDFALHVNGVSFGLVREINTHCLVAF